MSAPVYLKALEARIAEGDYYPTRATREEASALIAALRIAVGALRVVDECAGYCGCHTPANAALAGIAEKVEM
jgi:hypothetical protein